MLYNSRRPTRSHVTTLARKLRAVDYFTLGWGTMVGVGWLVIMDDWLLANQHDRADKNKCGAHRQHVELHRYVHASYLHRDYVDR